ncbi:hypothetical protein CALVIDRAFT_602595, partial [Calocera viscosa TUFC12733]
MHRHSEIRGSSVRTGVGYIGMRVFLSFVQVLGISRSALPLHKTRNRTHMHTGARARESPVLPAQQFQDSHAHRHSSSRVAGASSPAVSVCRPGRLPSMAAQLGRLPPAGRPSPAADRRKHPEWWWPAVDRWEHPARRRGKPADGQQPAVRRRVPEHGRQPAVWRRLPEHRRQLPGSL